MSSLRVVLHFTLCSPVDLTQIPRHPEEQERPVPAEVLSRMQLMLAELGPGQPLDLDSLIPAYPPWCSLEDLSTVGLWEHQLDPLDHLPPGPWYRPSTPTASSPASPTLTSCSGCGRSLSLFMFWLDRWDYPQCPACALPECWRLEKLHERERLVDGQWWGPHPYPGMEKQSQVYVGTRSTALRAGLTATRRAAWDQARATGNPEYSAWRARHLNRLKSALATSEGSASG